MEIDNVSKSASSLEEDNKDPRHHMTARQFHNLQTLNLVLMSDPTLSVMLKHRQGLQHLSNSLAAAGKEWHNEFMLSNGGKEPPQGAMEIEEFTQHLALSYPVPYHIYKDPDMDTLHKHISM
jgi:hypothetical protein